LALKKPEIIREALIRAKKRKLPLCSQHRILDTMGKEIQIYFTRSSDSAADLTLRVKA